MELSNNGDGTVSVNKKPDAEVQQVRDVASEVGVETIDTLNGEYKSTVIKHRAWIWVGGAIGTAVGVTVVGLGTAFVIEQYKRKSKRTSK